MCHVISLCKGNREESPNKGGAREGARGEGGRGEGGGREGGERKR